MTRERLAVAAGALVLAGLLVVRLFPFETVVAARKVALWRHGVRRVRSATLLGYERDQCAAGAACHCVALIHGLGDSALTWDKVLTDPSAPALGARLFAVDLPGTEGSDAPPSPEGYRVAAMALAVRDALAPRCPAWTVAGNSLGGWVALSLALQWPAGVESLVLVDSAGLDDPSGKAESAARFLADPTIEGLQAFRHRSRYSVAAVPGRAWASARDAIRRRPTQSMVFAMSRDQLLDGRLGGLKVPATIVWGEADGVIPPEVGERLHAALSGSRLVKVPRCGHLPQQECPEAVVDALRPR